MIPKVFAVVKIIEKFVSKNLFEYSLVMQNRIFLTSLFSCQMSNEGLYWEGPYFILAQPSQKGWPRHATADQCSKAKAEYVIN